MLKNVNDRITELDEKDFFRKNKEYQILDDKWNILWDKLLKSIVTIPMLPDWVMNLMYDNSKRTKSIKIDELIKSITSKPYTPDWLMDLNDNSRMTELISMEMAYKQGMIEGNEIKHKKIIVCGKEINSLDLLIKTRISELNKMGYFLENEEYRKYREIYLKCFKIAEKELKRLKADMELFYDIAKLVEDVEEIAKVLAYKAGVQDGKKYILTNENLCLKSVGITV